MPSLNDSGKRISKRQYALMRGRALNGKSNAFERHRRKSLVGNSDFTRAPGVARVAPNQERERPFLTLFIRKPNDNHKTNLGRYSGVRKVDRDCGNGHNAAIYEANIGVSPLEGFLPRAES